MGSKKPYLYLTLAMVISGSAVVTGKIISAVVPTFLATEIGIFIGLLCLLPVTFLYRRELIVKDVKTNGIMFLQACYGVVFYRLLVFGGLHYTTAIDSGLITSVSPVVVVLMGCVFLREKIGPRQSLGVGCVFLGLIAVNSAPYILSDLSRSEHALKGNLMILLAVLSEAVFSVLSKVNCKSVSAYYRTTMILLYAFFLLLPFAVHDMMAFDGGAINLKIVICLLYYGIFVSFFSYIFWFKGIEGTSISNAAVFTSIVPVSSTLLSRVFLNEPISVFHSIGIACILAGILLSSNPSKHSLLFKRKDAL